MKNIEISVVMSVYNGEKYLREAIESILNQTYMDFEFIIIDDCSTDHTWQIITSYTDSRIKAIQNKQNMKLPSSLNIGLGMARGDYIARMDADDIALPDRFEKQIKYLEKYTDVAVIGGSFQIINEFGEDICIKKALCDELLEKYYFMPSPIAHPTAMLRKSMTVDKGFFYDEKYTSAQDYDLWMRIAQKYKINNIPDVVLKYRVHTNSISKKRSDEQKNNAANILIRSLPVCISVEEARAILRQKYKLSPWKHMLCLYKVFPYMNYWFLRRSLGYAYHYFGAFIKSLNLCKGGSTLL